MPLYQRKQQMKAKMERFMLARQVNPSVTHTHADATKPDGR